ncbi:MAG: glycosyltransferase family 2 protein, partial [Nitrosopumilaceae archaeon]
MANQIKSRYKKLSKLFKISTGAIHDFGFMFFVRAAYLELRKNKLSTFSPEPESIDIPTVSESVSYQQWLKERSISQESKSWMKNELQTFSYKPRIGIIISVNNSNKQYLGNTLNSIADQGYDNFEIRLSCPMPLLREIHEHMEHAIESRINWDAQESISSENALFTNMDFVAFVDSGNVVTEDALFSIVKFLNENPDADIIYSDEDRVDQLNNRTDPFFKPDWSPELFLSMDYISNFYVVRSKLLDKTIFNDQYGEAKHYDLLLRLTEKTKNIFHIPAVFISVRQQNDKKLTISFMEHALKAVTDALNRRGIRANVTKSSSTIRVEYLLDREPKVSIIIPTRDNKFLLARCLKSIKEKTSYRNYEIVIVDNNSTKEETLSYLKSLPYTIVKYDAPFNFSKISNVAVSSASGEHILFLSDDVAALEPNWLKEMVSTCQQDGIGIVGPKLIFSNKTIQHAGVVFLKTGAGFHPLQGVDANSSIYFGFLNVVRNCSAVTGACLLIKKKIFDEVGGFDDKFDLYYNDADLCMKVISHGYRVVYTPYAM